MLKSLTLKNFRGFDSHTIPLKDTSVIVGRNNAGKSTIAEALRLVSVVTQRYRTSIYRPVPEWLDLPTKYRGITPSLSNIDFDFENVCHRYGEPPAEIHAHFDSGCSIKVYLGPNQKQIYAIIYDRKRNHIITKTQAVNVEIPGVSILPQIFPIHRHEKILTQDYVRQSFDTNLASLHFRNQINYKPELYGNFKILAEATWPSLQIHSFENQEGQPGSELSLLVRDGSFVAEVGWMGHGLQIWLQTVWFLARVPSTHTVILDEPDVYLHADLQRNLFRLVRRRYRQLIVATHSIEIMSEADPEHILIVDKTRKKSQFATSLPAVQRVIDHIGGIHNLQLARLWTARCCLLVEGEDTPFLKAFQDLLFPDSKQPFDTIPSIAIGGWGGWKLALGSSMFLKNAGDENILTYCILDSDYRTAEEIESVRAEAAAQRLHLHVWHRKEIENYLIIPNAVRRFIESRMDSGKGSAPSVDELTHLVSDLAQKQRDDVFDAMASEILARNRSLGPGGANKLARAQLKAAWESELGRLSLVSGKRLIADLSAISKERWGVSLNRLGIARTVLRWELDPEVISVVTCIEQRKAFPAEIS